MGTMVQLKASDGHDLAAYRAEPAGSPRAGLVVIQEIFGVNSHIRSVADGFAADGYVVLAPALFDRVKPGIELSYEPDDIEQGRAIRAQIAHDDAVKDMAAAVEALRGEGLKVGVVGYCWGGSLAWNAATRLDGVAAAVGYYGGMIPDMADEQPKGPILLHFGENDASIPLEGVEKVKAAHPEVQVHIYPAGHGFNCDQRGSYHAESAKLARTRTLEFFAQHL
jgi:carboxymethylenebutenolidase